MITLEAAALHSVIQRTFSGNSSEAEIHLQICLVSVFCSWEGDTCSVRVKKQRT